MRLVPASRSPINNHIALCVSWRSLPEESFVRKSRNSIYMSWSSLNGKYLLGTWHMEKAQSIFLLFIYVMNVCGISGNSFNHSGPWVSHWCKKWLQWMISHVLSALIFWAYNLGISFLSLIWNPFLNFILPHGIHLTTKIIVMVDFMCQLD